MRYAVEAARSRRETWDLMEACRAVGLAYPYSEDELARVVTTLSRHQVRWCGDREEWVGRLERAYRDRMVQAAIRASRG